MTTHPAVPLRASTLSDLPSSVSVPTYDRSALVPSVVHIGVGGFHRAHQGVYFDELARRGQTGWGLVGVGMHSREVGEVLAAQDCLYLVVERGPQDDDARVVGSLTRYLLAAEQGEQVLAALADPRTRLVTLTITGTAYLIDPHTGKFDTADPSVAADLDDLLHPRSVFGCLVEALHRRRRDGHGPFTVLSCDNMPDNGSAARAAVLAFATERDARTGDDLAAWIGQHVTFPSSMVDRITPTTTPEDRDAVVERFGVDDRWPVITEPFSQWVVQDDFCAGRPPLEQVGVQFVEDVGPYETMKTRLLNASHCALAYLGLLAGYRTIDQVLADDVFRDYLERLMGEEIAPLLPSVPGIDLAEYQRSLVQRLSNPRMGDDLARLGRRGSSKMPHYVLPSVDVALQVERPHQLLVLAVAAWVRFLRGYDYAGQELPVQGPLKDQLVELAQDGGVQPEPVLAQQEVFGPLGLDIGFAAEVEVALRALEEQGPREVVQLYLGLPGRRPAS